MKRGRPRIHPPRVKKIHYKGGEGERTLCAIQSGYDPSLVTEAKENVTCHRCARVMQMLILSTITKSACVPLAAHLARANEALTYWYNVGQHLADTSSAGENLANALREFVNFFTDQSKDS